SDLVIRRDGSGALNRMGRLYACSPHADARENCQAAVTFFEIYPDPGYPQPLVGRATIAPSNPFFCLPELPVFARRLTYVELSYGFDTPSTTNSVLGCYGGDGGVVGGVVVDRRYCALVI